MNVLSYTRSSSFLLQQIQNLVHAQTGRFDRFKDKLLVLCVLFLSGGLVGLDLGLL